MTNLSNPPTCHFFGCVRRHRCWPTIHKLEELGAHGPQINLSAWVLCVRLVQPDLECPGWRVQAMSSLPPNTLPRPCATKASRSASTLPRRAGHLRPPHSPPFPPPGTANEVTPARTKHSGWHVDLGSRSPSLLPLADPCVRTLQVTELLWPEADPAAGKNISEGAFHASRSKRSPNCPPTASPTAAPACPPTCSPTCSPTAAMAMSASLT